MGFEGRRQGVSGVERIRHRHIGRSNDFSNRIWKKIMKMNPVYQKASRSKLMGQTPESSFSIIDKVTPVNVKGICWLFVSYIKIIFSDNRCARRGSMSMYHMCIFEPISKYIWTFIAKGLINKFGYVEPVNIFLSFFNVIKNHIVPKTTQTFLHLRLASMLTIIITIVGLVAWIQ